MSFFSSRLGTRSRSVTYDPYKSYVTMLVRGEDANNVTPTDTFTGRSFINHSSNVYTSAARSKFGNSSLRFTGIGEGLRADWGVGNSLDSNFTWEFWVNLNSFSSNLGSYMAFLDNRTYNVIPNLNSGYFIGCNKSSGLVYVFSSAGALINSSTSLSLNTWYHIAFTRSGSTLKLWINGQKEGSDSTDVNTVATPNFFLGKSPDNDNYLNGYLDEIRITEGIARYTNNFPKPTARFETAIDQTSYKVKARGGIVYVNGNYKYHLFLTSTDFVVDQIIDSSASTEFFLVDGGGASNDGSPGEENGGNGGAGGGGGSGGYYWEEMANNFGNLFAAYTYTATVGSAGNASTLQTAGTTRTCTQSGASGGSGGGGGNSSWPNLSATAGGPGSGGRSNSWGINGNIIYYASGGGGGGGGGGADCSLGIGPVAGANGGAGDTSANNGGKGGGGGIDAENGSSPAAGYYIGGFGGGGGGGGKPDCNNPGGPGGLGGAASSGMIVIRYVYK